MLDAASPAGLDRPPRVQNPYFHSLGQGVYEATPRGPELSPRQATNRVIPDLRDSILDTWRTTNRVTVFFVERLPTGLWTSAVPGAPRRSIRMIAGHIHNARCMWLKTLGREQGIAVPRSVDRHRVGRKELARALNRSGRGILRLLALGCERGGSIPIPSTYIWRNLPLDVGHVLAYFVAHEAHHRGQIVLAARELGYRLPLDVTSGIWQWTTRAREAKERDHE
jgi:uncharacterized damage-inducible protein DinB